MCTFMNKANGDSINSNKVMDSLYNKQFERSNQSRILQGDIPKQVNIFKNDMHVDARLSSGHRLGGSIKDSKGG